MSDSAPMPSEPSFALVGPFRRHDVVVRGRQVPFLTAEPGDHGQVHLTLDHRLGLDLTASDAERVVPFLADAVAVALGYTCHPDATEEPNPRLPFPRMTGLGA